MIVRATGLGTSRNGAPEGGGYKFRKYEDWSPENGVHLDEDAVAPGVAAAGRWPGGKAARLAAYAEARRSGLTQAQAAERVEIAPDTAVKYERAYRRLGAS